MFSERTGELSFDDDNDEATVSKKTELRQAIIRVAFDQASTVIKALLLFNGGAILGILSFIAQSKDNASMKLSVNKVADAMALFGGGAIAALACAFLTFMAASMHAHAQLNQGYDKSLGVRTVGIWLALFSIFLFSFGIWSAVAGIR